MASIHKEVELRVAAERAWASLRKVGDAHELFAPVLVDGKLDGDTRTVRFANGMVAQERILDVDDKRRRVAYTALEVPGLEFHHASMQIVDAGPGRSKFVWITDLLPAAARDSIAPLIDEGSRALKTNLEAAQPAAATSRR
jgi:Polyketide cyclase / dehydrase and lipid transport